LAAKSRSWLAKAKSIHDLGQFYVPNASKPWNEKRELLSERKWAEMRRKPIPVAEEFRSYFGGWMHDSRVMEVERTKAVFRMRVHCDIAVLFAESLARLLKVDDPEVDLPIDLLLHDPVYVRAARYDARGALRFKEWDSFGQYSERKIEFITDWFHEQNGRIQWIVELWDWRETDSAMSTGSYLMVDACRATAVDHCGEAFDRTFGRPAGELWRDALLGLGGPAGWSELTPFLERRMSERGISRVDFRQES